jgi:hypothetical protein
MTSNDRSWPLATHALLRSSWRLRLWAVLALAAGIGLENLSLFARIGFEHALATSLLGSLVGIDVGGWLARAQQRRAVAPHTHRQVLASLAVAVGLAIGLTLIPITLAAVVGLWKTTCDWSFGLVAEFGMPIVSTALAALVSYSIVTLVGAQRRFWSRLLPWLALVITAGHGLWRFYSAPPVFSYNPIVGYFPGNLYDEDIRLSAAFWWARADAVSLVIALCAASVWRFDPASHAASWRGAKLQRPASIAAAISLLALLSFAALRSQAGQLGYSIDASDIDRTLGSTLTTKHFNIHYDAAAPFAKDIELIADDHEFRYQQVVARLGIAPKGRIDSYYFANTDQKARWMGARDVEMAKPWRREIYLDHREFPHSSLRHEIAHIVAGAAGDPWFAVSAQRVLGMPLRINPGLIEGMAVALDWPGGFERNQTPHQAVRVIQAMGQQPTLRDLMSLGFLSMSSSTSYTTAGSFVHFLFETYGADKVRKYYGNGGDIMDAFGIDAVTMQSNWRDMLATIAISNDVITANRERFRQGSVFSRPCPHAIAKAQRAAETAMQHGDLDGAIAELRAICDHDRGEPRHRLLLASFLDTGDAAMKTEAADIWTALSSDKNNSVAIQISAMQALAVRAVRNNDLHAASGWLQSALKLPSDDGTRRQLEALRIASEQPGLFGETLRSYFFSRNLTTENRLAWAQAVVATPAPTSTLRGLGQYLRGLRKMDVSDWAGAANDLQASIVDGLPSDNFRVNAARRLAIAGFRSKQRSALQLAIELLQSPNTTDVDKLLAADWSERMSLYMPATNNH